MTYQYGAERFRDVYKEFEPLFKMQYAEMTARLEKDGHKVSPYNPNYEAYSDYNDRNYLIFFTVRKDGEPVAYASVYIMPDMHNGDLLATEDTIYVHPDHRNGVGRILTKKVLEVLRRFGVKRAEMTATTDPRATVLWKRLGFKEKAVQLAYYFEGN